MFLEPISKISFVARCQHFERKTRIPTRKPKHISRSDEGFAAEMMIIVVEMDF
ncbi:MAG: hypothetical protein G01um101466_68 [Parcubacteria group bacterium Gr01-1014_66]|nr:MAG: hypothetical protein G01um101466_68 [Parcubacteria group bacterium Gr01-1014_66]